MPNPDELLEKRLRALLTDLDWSGVAEIEMPKEQDLSEVHDRLARGCTEGVQHARSARTVDVVLGLDFGTSSTKIVARLPFEAGAPAFAVPVPPCFRAEGHAHLWASRLWLGGDGMFSLVPLLDAPAYSDLKTALMREDGDRTIVLHSGAWGATALEAAAAFLALQFRQARGWLLAKQGAALGAGALRWSYHVGFPAASLDTTGLRERYTAACTVGLRLSRSAEPVSLRSVRDELQKRLRSKTDEALEQHDMELVPEICAAVAGFARSTSMEAGLYAMIDVGAGTVDCCTFNLVERPQEGDTACPIFRADVAMLGVAPSRACSDDPELAAYFERKLARQQHEVIWDTKSKRYRRSERWRTELPVFLTGGGAASAPHRRVTSKLDGWLRRFAAGGARVLSLPVPDGVRLECSAENAHRLAVALGLSMPILDIPKALLPTSIDDDKPAVARDYGGTFISKDMV